jgi:hypothetical protein
VLDLGMSHGLGERSHDGGRDAPRVQLPLPVLRIASHETSLELAVELPAVLDSRARLGEARILRELRGKEHLAEIAEPLVVHRAHVEEAVVRPVASVSRPLETAMGDGIRRLRDACREQPEYRVEHGDVEARPFIGPFAKQQRGEDRPGGVNPLNASTRGRPARSGSSSS